MASIGDLFFSLRGDPKQLEVDVKKAGDRAGTSFGSRMSASLKKSWSGGEIGKGLVQGLGLAGGLGAARLFSSAISGVVDVLGDATAAAIADEESQNRLAASLRANVKGWNGNTKAIEANILAKQRLGFDDETLRDSLTVLVGATHDVTKATKIQNVAMDLARFKGISLKEASEALIKVEGGVFRSLKQLGIKLKDNATSTEALAAVQAVASGQAEAYANTNAGKLLASQIKVGEAMEKLGARIMPLVVDATVAAADATAIFVSALDLLNGKLPETAEESHEVIDSLLSMLDVLGVVNPAAKGMAEEVRTSMQRMRTATGEFQGKVKDDLIDGSGSVVGSFDTVGEEALDLGAVIKGVTDGVGESFEGMADNMIADAKRVIDEAFDPLETRAELYDDRSELLANEAKARNAKTKADVRNTADDIIQSLDDQANTLADLATTGDLTAADVAQFERDVKRNYKTMSKEARADIDKVIARLKVLAGMKLPPITQKVNIVTRKTTFLEGKADQRAAGGPVRAGQPYLVGERGPEIVVPRTNGTVLPNALSMSGGTPLGGSTTINVRMDAANAARDPFEVATQLRRMADMKVLTR